jgi:basic membrane protein A
MKKFLSLFLVLAVLLTAVCAVSADDFKVGVILVHDENSGYDQAHIEGVQGAAERLGLSADQIIFKYNIPESEECFDSAVDLAEQGCKLIISDSYGHQAYMMEAAREYPDVHFIASTGDTAWKEGIDNVSNMFPHTFESRYVSGVVAGMKLKELLDSGAATDPHVGYVGAYPYAEVVSGYTGFFLGIRSIVPDAYMEVQYTNSWYDPNAEAAAAEALMSRGCVIIGQHADSTGAPSAIQAAQDKGAVVYSVGYNIDMRAVAPTAALTSAQNCWVELYTPMIEAAMKGEPVPTDYSVGYAHDGVKISDLGESCAPGTQEAVDAAIAAIKDGTLNVFDCSTFTVNGEHPTQAFALDTDGDWAADSEEAIIDGVFHESEVISAPYFSFRIDGITELTNE